METTHFSSENWNFWYTELYHICQHFELPCRPFSDLFSIDAFAKLERCSVRQLQDKLDAAGRTTDKSLSGKPMVRARDFFEVFCKTE